MWAVGDVIMLDKAVCGIGEFLCFHSFDINNLSLSFGMG